MQAANVRGVGELFASLPQVSRIARLEAEVKELRRTVEALGGATENEQVPRRIDGLRVVNLSAVRACNSAESKSYCPPIRVSNR